MAVWVVVGALFLVIMVQHIKNRSFHYPEFEFLARTGSNTNNMAARGQDVDLATVTNSKQGPLTITTRVYKDNSVSASVSVFGTELDAPARKIAKDFNQHIDLVNQQKDEDNFILIILDGIGLVTALFSVGYEASKIRADPA